VRLQELEFSCGANAIVNALRALGRNISERRVRQLTGTNRDGTDEHEIVQGLAALGHGSSQFESAERKPSLAWITESLRAGRPAIICVDSWQHWVLAAGMLGNGFVVIDGKRTPRNRIECGTYVYRTADFLRRWRNAREGRYYGISVALRETPR
jgi:ABC-type bacteriocin/lantibiotic exporter with double-glycine peptidase domain